jgi:hypothetical protein
MYAVLLGVLAVAQFGTVFSARCIICFFLGVCTIGRTEAQSLQAKGVPIEVTKSTKPISADFPFQSRYETVKGSKLHYIDEGDPTAEYTFLLKNQELFGRKPHRGTTHLRRPLPTTISGTSF